MMGRRRAPLALAAALLVLFSAETASARKAGQTCAVDRNCDAGLHCETCVADGNVRPRCTRVAPVDPQTKVRRTLSPELVAVAGGVRE